VPDHILESGDSPDLEALFDSIASQQKEVNLSSPHRQLTRQAAEPSTAVMYEQIGQLTRKMHDACVIWAMTSRWKSGRCHSRCQGPTGLYCLLDRERCRTCAQCH
jgi:hypothetical protein